MSLAIRFRFLFLVLLLARASPAQDLEFSLTGGRSRGQRFQDMYLSEVNDTGGTDVLSFPLRIRPDLTLAARVTLNSRRFISNEFFYTAIYGRLEVGSGDVVETERLRIREAGYNLLVNILRKNSVVRPYFAVGPSLTSYRYANLDVRDRSGAFRFGLRDVGAIRTAFTRSGVAPLDGGTIFRAGLNYGVGIRVRVYHQLIFRADVRETFSKDPDFFSKQSVSLNDVGIVTAQDPGTHRRDVFTVGVGFGP